ncbi:hypothetical protein AB0D67_15810 [Streptosporangium sp. NPDC048047]|uniref:hypothetical protein n=1 Tax=unclassified Streptosporangium TaxID=2632669 RepID=UPI00342E47B7
MPNRPVTLAVAAAVVALEGTLALILGGYVGVETVIGKPSDTVSSLFVAGFGIAVGAALLWVAWGLLGSQRWARGPGVVAQIFTAIVAITLIQSGQGAMGVPLVAAALAGLVTLLSPPTTHALYGDDRPD